MPVDRDPMTRVRDAIVATPLSLSVATRRAAPILFRLGRRQLQRASHIISVAQHTGDRTDPSASTLSPPPDDRRASSEALAGSASTGDPETAAVPDAEALPIEGYDNLAARQVVDRLDTLPPSDLAIVAAYERANRHRQTVLGRIGQLTL